MSFSRISPTCLSCLRRGLGSSNGTSSTTVNSVGSSIGSVASPMTLIQARGKTKGRPRDLGVVVRLLTNVVGFGPKHSIFRVARGRMRNMWLPNGRAEYMTQQRFAELGLTKDAIGTRDPFFGLKRVVDEEITKGKQKQAADKPEVAAKPKAVPAKNAVAAPKLNTNTLPAAAAAELLEAIIPPVLAIYCTIIPQHSSAIHRLDLTPPPPPPPTISPLVPSNATVSGRPAEQPHLAAEEEEPRRGGGAKIYGSVTHKDLRDRINAMLRTGAPDTPLVLGEHDISIEGVAEGGKIVKLGRYDYQIEVPHPQDGGGGKEKKRVEPLRRVVELVAADPLMSQLAVFRSQTGQTPPSS